MKDLICYLFHKKIKIEPKINCKSDMVITSSKKCEKCNNYYYDINEAGEKIKHN